MTHQPSARRRVGAGLAALAVVLCGLVAAPAAADTDPPPGVPETVAADALPTAQVDGVVWDQEIVGDRVYAVGNFTSARPAGAAPGTQTVARRHMLAYTLSTGVLVPDFAPLFNGEVKSVTVSPDGQRVYVGGSFVSLVVGGVTHTRNRVAAFNAVTGALLPFAPVFNGRVDVVKATNDTLYVGGNFSAVNSASRVRLAALDTTASIGPVRALSVTADLQINALALSPDGRTLVAGGKFTTFNGSSTPGYGLARVDTATGASLSLPVNSLIRNGGVNASIYNLYGDATGFYGVGYVFGSGGNLEGAFSADWAGNLRWVEDCHGDSYDVYTSGQVTYTVGHPHFCSTVGGFPQTEPWTSYFATAFTNYEDRKVGRNPYPQYFQFQGQPGPSMLTFFPDLTAGTFTGASQAAWTVTGDGRYVLLGGEFTRVNGTPQQGLVRMAVDTIAPNAQGPRLGGAAFNPRLVSATAGTVRVVWPGNWDRDHRTLTYRLYRDGNTTTPILTRPVAASFWEVPMQTFTDTGLTPGSTRTYRVTATDPKGRTAGSEWVSVTVAGSSRPYHAAVLADGATQLWRLGESSGTAVADSAAFLDAQAAAGVTRGAAGAIVNDPSTASTFSGTSSGYASTRTSVQGPDTLSIEAWVRTTSTSGGKIVGLGNRTNGASTGYDRHLYLDNQGRVYFGVNPGAIRTVSSAPGLNDGAWHHVVGTLGPAGMVLYVDGTEVARRTDTTGGQWLNGFWTIGGDNLNGWPGTRSSNFLAGSIDEVAIYPTALSAQQVRDHHTIARSQTAPNQAPVASFTTSSSGLTAAVDGRGSTDPDGTIASYAWDFGDSTSGTGATAQHTYAAAGTYTVTLRVTDAAGATGTTTRSVTVTAPPAGGALVVDDFERVVASGWGAAPTGGPWTAGSGTSVAGSRGVHTLGAAGRTLTSYLGSVSSTSSDIGLTLGVDKASTGGGQLLSVIGRRVGTSEYRARIKIAAGGAVELRLERDGTLLAGTTATAAVGTYTPGTRLRVRVQVTGTNPTTVRARVWNAAGTEPAAWQVSASDSTASHQAAGAVGVMSYLSGSATNAPVTVSWDDLRVVPGG